MLANGQGTKYKTPQSLNFPSRWGRSWEIFSNIVQSMEILILEYDANIHYPQDGHMLGACSIPLCFSTARLSQQQQGGKPVGPNSQLLPKICFRGFPKEILQNCEHTADEFKLLEIRRRAISRSLSQMFLALTTVHRHHCQQGQHHHNQHHQGQHPQ